MVIEVYVGGQQEVFEFTNEVYLLQGIIDSTRTETRQVFSRMFVSTKNLWRCLLLLEMEKLLVLDVCLLRQSF